MILLDVSFLYENIPHSLIEQPVLLFVEIYKILLLKEYFQENWFLNSTFYYYSQY